MGFKGLEHTWDVEVTADSTHVELGNVLKIQLKHRRLGTLTRSVFKYLCSSTWFCLGGVPDVPKSVGKGLEPNISYVHVYGMAGRRKCFYVSGTGTYPRVLPEYT